MIKDFLICFLATLNLQIFSFLSLHQAALAQVMNYSPSSNEVSFEVLMNQVQEDLIEKTAVSLQDQIVYETRGPIIVVDDVDQSIASPYLSIPKLGVIVPVAFEPDFTIDEMNSQLRRGVVSHASFPYRGNHQQIIVYGHSSDYPWIDNPYSSVFTLLPKLEIGDRFQLVYGTRSYWYEMEKSLITNPALTQVLAEAEESSLVLTTCYPIGFNYQRYNVVAKRI